MAKDKEKEQKHDHKLMHNVYKSGDKYFCGECGAELEMDKDCPVCKKGFNWEKITTQVRWG